MSLSLIDSIPKNRIALVANGRERVSQEVIIAIKLSRLIIAVDGGLNLCNTYQIEPQYLIGDLDSVDMSVLSKYKKMKVIKLERAKDILDLEAGIQLAQKLDRNAIPCLFNALGGRRDHHLSNLYLLMKFPKTILVTRDRLVTRLHNDTQRGISQSLDQKMIFAFYGEGHLRIGAEDVYLQRGGLYKLVADRPTQAIGGGMLMLIRDFSSGYSSIRDILPLENMQFPYSDEEEDIYLLNSRSSYLKLSANPGLTISLIPWLGKVGGIKTKGLKWNLWGNEMNKGFIGTSNIALENHISISIDSGSLLCIVEKKVIDKEMVSLKDHSSTARFTTQSKL